MRASAAIFVLFAATCAHAIDAVPLMEFGDTAKVEIAFDPLTASGYLEQNGAFVAFAIDQPFIALDWKKPQEGWGALSRWIESNASC